MDTERKLTKYTVFCETEKSWVSTGYLEEVPTVCPNNNLHKIETVTILDTVDTSLTKVVEDTSGTQGYFKISGFSFDVDAGVGVITDHHIIFNYPIKVYNLMVLPKSNNIGDSLSVSIKDVHVGLLVGDAGKGVISADVSVGDSVIGVDDITLGVVKLGFLVKLGDPTKENLGECISIDKDNKTITVSNNTSATYSTGDKILITIVKINNVEISTNDVLVFGAGKLGGMLVPTKTTMTVQYTNTSTEAKRVVGFFEHDY
ncbi:MAG: hypothetical protein COA94_02090 [Rickettsiales bacterium]|nr:MAG: hypothetical protein COA94_02090 [Rickettsiales bacterium]